MKLIDLTNIKSDVLDSCFEFGHDIAQSANADNIEAKSDTLPPIGIATDSAMVSMGRPLFLPETAREWQMTISPAYRIGRLGKSIPARFVDRHIDAITLVAHVTPIGANPCDPINTAIDNSYAIGRWIDPEQPQQIIVDSPDLGDRPQFLPQFDHRSHIAAISKYFTLKSGDIIVTPPSVRIPAVAIDTHIEARLNGQPILTFNIK